MRIVFFVHRYWPSVGGVERYVQELGHALLRLGHDVEVVAGGTTPDLPERDVHSGVSVRRFPATRSPTRCRMWLWQHRRLFQDADVVHVSNTHMLEYYWRMLGPVVRRDHIFLTRHGMAMRYPVPRDHVRRAHRAQRLARGIAHDGMFIARHLGVRADICPNQGLSPTADYLDVSPEPQPDSAVFIGRLEFDTGILMYLELLQALRRRYGLDVALDVYGEGSLAPHIRRCVDRHSLPVRLHGSVPDAQRFIEGACFAFVNGRMAMQEAMARRRLVVAAFDHELKRDYVCGEPFSPHLVSGGSADALAGRVVHYIHDHGARANLIEHAHAYARGLTWERTANAFLHMWRSRLHGSGELLSRRESIRLAWTLSREARGS